MHGWMGKILEINLSTFKISELETLPYAEKYLGGRGIAARIYWEIANVKSKAFDPENPLIFMTGPLVASGAQAATVMSVLGKAPGALPEGYCFGNIAGFAGAELKKAGYDGIIITGKAIKPVYLWINDEKVEILDATALWGHRTYQTGEMLQQRHGSDIKFIVIGVSGENRVRTAVAFASHESAASCGFGALMGSKNLKAIAIKGSGRVTVANPEKLKELNRYTFKINERVALAMPPDTARTGHANLLEVIGKGGCYLCGSKCIRNVYRYDARMGGLRHCQTMEYYLPWIYGQGNEPVETFFNAPTMANDYAIDTFELRSMINWLYACYNARALSESETGLPLSKIGTQEFLEKLLHSIAYREGFGDILAEGLVRAADKVPAEARALLSHEVAPIGQNELQPMRLIIVHSLLYSMEPRVFQPLVHDTGFVLVAWNFNQREPGSNPVTNKVVRNIARAFWGSEEAGNLSSYEGKALAAKIIQNRVALKDSLGLCDFTWPITYSFNTPDNVGDPNLEGELYAAVTGRDAKELEKYGNVITNLQRAILIREGRELPAADYPQEYNFTEPLGGSGMQEILVPGEGDQAVNMAGNKLDKPKFTKMLKEYYQIRGWDEETGIPKTETLKALGMGDVAGRIHQQITN